MPTLRRKMSLSFSALAAVAMLALLLGGCGSSGNGSGDNRSAAAFTPTTAEQQLDFGTKMARRGLWSEALFRFRQAERLRGPDARILNNIAVAHEALGQFDEALEAYQKAVEKAPGNPELRRNYTRFVEFYRNFRPQPTEPEADS
ncbi:MAG: tetratricopeptide repeat protein [Acidobacteriota bacterium]